LKALRWYVKFIDGLNEKVGYFTAWLTTLLVLVVCYDVFTRYVLNSSKVAVQELEWHIFSVIFLIGAAYTLLKDKHVRVDVFYMKMPEKIRAWIDFLGNLIFLIPYSMLVIYTSYELLWYLYFMLLKYITKLRNNRGQRTTYFLSFKASKGVLSPVPKVPIG
jgi:TRAP-type mannitol/chloroaromatic compound transport system permease small subunit